MESHEGDWQVPGYSDVRELGRGGGGRVVLARRDADEAYVAIKYLSAHLRADTDFIQRFRGEAQLIATLDDPHTARMYEYVEGDDGAAIVMEWVDGVTLRRLLAEEGATGPEAALLVLKGALLGLAAAHRTGIVHRDFKPENVMVTAIGDSKLVDFGVATFSGETMHVAGTPPYMAPEQWREAPAGPATDVYAATVVFFECLTGTRPFQADDLAALAHQHQTMPPPIERIQDQLRGLVRHGMAKNPEDRPPSAEVFLVELEESAVATYGSEWEERGRLGLAALAASYMALSPLSSLAQPVPTAGSTLAKTTLTPAVKLAVAGAVAVVTMAGMVSAIAIWDDSAPVTYNRAQPPIVRQSSAPPSPTSAPATTPPPPTETAQPQPSLTTSAVVPLDSAGPRPPDPSPTTSSAPTASPAPKPSKPAPTQEPTRKPTTAPTTGPTSAPTKAPTTGPTAQPPATSAQPPPPPTTAPATPPPDNPTLPPAANAADSLIKVDVSVSVGDLLDANVGVGVLDTKLDIGLNVGGK